MSLREKAQKKLIGCDWIQRKCKLTQMFSERTNRSDFFSCYCKLKPFFGNPFEMTAKSIAYRWCTAWKKHRAKVRERERELGWYWCEWPWESIGEYPIYAAWAQNYASLITWCRIKGAKKHKNVRRFILFSIYNIFFMSLIKWTDLVEKMRLKMSHTFCSTRSRRLAVRNFCEKEAIEMNRVTRKIWGGPGAMCGICVLCECECGSGLTVKSLTRQDRKYSAEQ